MVEKGRAVLKEGLKIAVVGFGIRGTKMSRLISAHYPSAKMQAICDIEGKALKNGAALYPDALLFTDFDEMLKNVKIDALLVETPAPYHATFSIKALNAGIHVLSDVPAVNSMDEARQLWLAAQNSDAVFMLQSTTSMFGYFAKLQELLVDGKLGKPYYIEAEYIHDLTELFGETPWRESYESIKYCTHSLGPVLTLLDEPLKEVVCFDTGSHVYSDPMHHDAMTAIFKTPSGVIVKLLVSFINRCPAHGHRYRIFGTEGYFERTVDFGDGAKSYWYSSDTPTEKNLVDLTVGEALLDNDDRDDVGNHGGANYELLKRFFHTIETGDEPEIGIKESLAMTLPGIFAAESARRNNAKLMIEYPWEE